MADPRTDRRVALITGGARGIGRAIGIDLAGRGWDIALCFRTSEDDARTACEAIESAGGAALAVRADVSDPNAVNDLVEKVVERFGRLDAVVNGAGPYHRAKLLEETPEGWRGMFANNLDPVLFTAQAAAPHMTERGFGRIVSFSMASADRVGTNVVVTAHYIAKMGVQALSKALAKKLAPQGITVNCISPGFVDSKSAPEEELRKMAKKIPAGHVGTVDDCVAAARYLLSDEASYVTGTNVVVSGGWGL